MTNEKLIQFVEEAFALRKANGFKFRKDVYWDWPSENGGCLVCAVLGRPADDAHYLDPEDDLANVLNIDKLQVFAMEAGFCSWEDCKDAKELHPDLYAFGQDLARRYL